MMAASHYHTAPARPPGSRRVLLRSNRRTALQSLAHVHVATHVSTYMLSTVLHYCSPVVQCPPSSAHVLQCPPMFCDVLICPPMSDLVLCCPFYVLQCLQMSSHVPQGIWFHCLACHSCVLFICGRFVCMMRHGHVVWGLELV